MPSVLISLISRFLKLELLTKSMKVPTKDFACQFECHSRASAPLAAGDNDVVKEQDIKPEFEKLNLDKMTVYLGSITGTADVVLSHDEILLNCLKIKGQNNKFNFVIQMEDCVVRFSAGKDTTFTTIVFIKVSKKLATDFMCKLSLTPAKQKVFRLDPEDTDARYKYIVFLSNRTPRLTNYLKSLPADSTYHWSRNVAAMSLNKVKTLCNSLNLSLSS